MILRDSMHRNKNYLLAKVEILIISLIDHIRLNPI